MPLTRRRLLGATALLGVATAAPAHAAAPPVPVDGPDPLIDWIAANRAHASLVVDDGRGAAFTHLPDRGRPIASAVKVVHLTAYARAVVAGTLDPAGPVPVADWERWYVPGTDGGAHPLAVQSLSVTPEGTVTWDDIAGVMIDFSDNAAPDLLRDTLGDAALIEAAAAGGWAKFDVPSVCGEILLSLDATDPALPGRRAAALAAARAYAEGDPRWRAVAATAVAPAPELTPEEAEAAWQYAAEFFDGATPGTAHQLAGLHRAVATERLGAEVSALLRRHLERVLAANLPPGVLGAGQKGGALPAVLSNAFTLRRTDGTVGVSVLSLSGLPERVYTEAFGSGAVTILSQQVVVDEAVRDRVRAAVSG